jgi:hypothetical protein
MIHIIAGDEAAKNLEAAFLLDENLRGDVLILKDMLGIGPIELDAEMNHDDVRTECWKIMSPNQIDHTSQDQHNVLQLIEKAVAEEEPVCFWMAPCVTDVCAYFWLLPYFKKQADMLHMINIIGLPFLNEKGQLFYPKNFSEVVPTEFLKTKRLLKKVTVAEYEVEGDEWTKLQTESTWVRVYEGGKKIVSKELTYYDSLLSTSLTTEFQKGTKVVNEAMKKCTQTLTSVFLEWRLRELVTSQAVAINGDVEKAVKDFEVKKVGEPAAEMEAESH